MKGSARARAVIAAPVNAEQRILKVCASVSDIKYLGFTVLRGIGQGVNSIILLKKMSKPCTQPLVDERS